MLDCFCSRQSSMARLYMSKPPGVARRYPQIVSPKAFARFR